MRRILTFLIFLALCSCGQQNEQSKTARNAMPLDSMASATALVTDEIGHAKISATEFLDWRKYQDSLRNHILNGKKNNLLKESFLQEMYIRNVAKFSNDSVSIEIPFNLHGPDCGAPDCYSTDLRFSFKPGNKFTFPKNIPFTEHEHGCVDKEQRISGTFQLVEETMHHVIYYSTRHKRTLVLFSSDKENETTAFYFTGLGENRINGRNVYTITKEYNEEDKNAIFPFTSWVLTTKEYEIFLP